MDSLRPSIIAGLPLGHTSNRMAGFAMVGAGAPLKINSSSPASTSQELQHVIRSYFYRGFKLTLLLAVHHGSVRIENRQRRHSLFEWRIVFLGDVQILIPVADADMYHDVVRRHNRRDILAVKRRVQHMVVDAPVPAEHQNHALVLAASRLERRRNLRWRRFGR